MDIGSILLMVALVVLVGAYIASPLRIGAKIAKHPEINIEVSELLAERERVLETLTELDFDNELGKIPDGLYPMQREALVKRGAAVLRLLDEIQSAETESETDTPLDLVLEYNQDDPGEALIAARRITRTAIIAKKDTNQKYCANCGAKIQLGDKFCPDCGQKL